MSEEMLRFIYGLGPLDELRHMVTGASWKDGIGEVRLRCGTSLRAQVDKTAFFALAVRATNKPISIELLKLFRDALTRDESDDGRA